METAGTEHGTLTQIRGGAGLDTIPGDEVMPLIDAGFGLGEAQIIQQLTGGDRLFHQLFHKRQYHYH